MFYNILVPIDLSKHPEAAVDMARELAQGAGARVTLLHVIETIPGADHEEFRSFYAELEERTAARLTLLAARFEGSGLDVGQTVVYGRPAEEILRFAVDRQVDLVVLASHQMEAPRTGRGWGTLSYKIGLLAPCPVLLVK